MKLHQAWTVTRITALAGALSMTACTAASSDVAVDGEDTTTTAEAMQARDQGAGQGKGGNESRPQGGEGTSRRGNHGHGSRHNGGVSQGQTGNESRSQGGGGTSHRRNGSHGTRNNRGVSQGKAGNESRSQGGEGTSRRGNHGTRNNRGMNQGQAGKTKPSVVDNDPTLTAGADVEVHISPDASSDVVRTISSGDDVNVECSTAVDNAALGVTETWYRLTDGNYVIPLTLTGDSSEITECDTTVILTASPSEGSTLDVYSRADESSEVVATIDANADVEIDCSVLVVNDDIAVNWYRLADGGYVRDADVSGSRADISACE